MRGSTDQLEVSEHETTSLVRLLAYTAMAIYYAGRVALLIVYGEPDLGSLIGRDVSRTPTRTATSLSLAPQRIVMIGNIHMGWEHVGFANYPVDPSVVSPHLPDALDVDTYDGEAWLSVVPFRNVGVRPEWAPEGVGLPLPELNLRTYATYETTTGETQSGVYFFSLDADGILGVSGARLFHHLPYYYADIDLRERGDAIRYESRRRHPGSRPAPFAATYEPTGGEFTADPDSVESFLTDRDRYFTETPGGDLRYARVDHERWPLYEAAFDIERNGLFRANGFDDPDSEPLCLYSPRVTTTATESKRLE